MPTRVNVIGPGGRLYADPAPGPDETKFKEDNNSDAYYNSPYYLQHKSQVQAIPPRRNSQPLSLANFLPPDIMTAIQSAGKVTFHSVGDTGAAKVDRSQSVGTAIGHEGAVADAMAADVQNGGNNGPAFFFHLGDVVYNFGEAQYYYDQFYEPFRAYDRPIFAIPGNHDGMVFGPTSSAPQVPTLAAFLENFCAAATGASPDSGGLMRSVMTQPGVYFTLDAPFVSIIGLYSNVLDSGSGVISSQGGHFPISDEQLTFLQSELTRLKPDRTANKRAIVVAVHHPPLSADVKHGGSSGETADLDTCCKAAGLYPDLVLSGHAHLYQRFTRTMTNGQQIPYIVSGSGGYAATAPKQLSQKPPITVGDHTLEIAPIVDFGYLTLQTDAQTLSVTFKVADQNGVVTQRDSVAVNLKTGKLMPGPQGTAAAPTGSSTPKPAASKPAASKSAAPKSGASKSGASKSGASKSGGKSKPKARASGKPKAKPKSRR